MNAYVDTVQSPAGDLAFAVDGEGVLISLQFAEGTGGPSMEEDLRERGFEVSRDGARTAPAREELRQYREGRRREFGLPLDLVGSGWQKRVWTELTRIPYGQTRSYGEVADRLDSPDAARAVGKANAANRLPLVVPCHRVIAADGSLGGFNGGLHLKERLLAHERRVLNGGGVSRRRAFGGTV